jgi:hypothetical protein
MFSKLHGNKDGGVKVTNILGIDVVDGMFYIPQKNVNMVSVVLGNDYFVETTIGSVDISVQCIQCEEFVTILFEDVLARYRLDSLESTCITALLKHMTADAAAARRCGNVIMEDTKFVTIL